jgi:hypothetical protein
MIKFEAGKTYQTRSPGDSNCVIRETIAKRTAKSVTTASGKTFRVTEWDGAETFRPWGSYSMAPAMSASRLVVA